MKVTPFTGPPAGLVLAFTADGLVGCPFCVVAVWAGKVEEPCVGALVAQLVGVVQAQPPPVEAQALRAFAAQRVPSG